MLTAYRIAKASHARTAFSGEGARLAGGRWNRPGEAVVYASASLALAAMETFVHLGEDGLQIQFVYFRVQIADGIKLQRCRQPPAQWRTEPPDEASQRYGSKWLRAGRTAVLEVPSAIIPSEKNFVLNPNHPDFSRLRIGRLLPFVFDPRMWT
ncbi:MAG TPA: RES family NAD+ phosphorylase [Burkholderiaceae bacterium]|nr:RES family NAD+ phosphorylase [Burkholderiaceae bacterium]